MDEYNESQVADDTWKFLRGNSTATLRFGEHLHEVSYVFCNDGTMVIPAMVAMLQPQDMVMYVPEYAEDCVEMHVTLEQFSEEGIGGVYADRWQMYHGESPDVQWARVTIDAARFHEMFVDGAGLHRENEFANEEPAMCKQLNTNPKELIHVCKGSVGVDVASPLLVGVDPFGLDIRARFGIVRLEPEKPFANTQEVQSFISRYN
ncbi:MAG: hypothetical protein QGI78_04885 [Phycisphaerales bacterium]|jgi:hypothetical protein|nr:hypothetical protein [Phycisphaerales bacterium]